MEVTEGKKINIRFKGQFWVITVSFSCYHFYEFYHRKKKVAAEISKHNRKDVLSAGGTKVYNNAL